MAHSLIGVTMNLDQQGRLKEGVDHSFIRMEYGAALRAAGAQPIYLDASVDPAVAAELCDGIVITGGDDLDPTLYGQQKTTDGPTAPRIRTDWERQLIDACDTAGVPILGICYGLQLLNVHYGGTLYQDIAADFGSDYAHGSTETTVDHPITFDKDFLGFTAGQAVPVKARHHQAVRDLAPGMQVVAHAEDNTVEAISGHGHYGVQWHAEVDASSVLIYGQFVRACMTHQRATAAAKRAMPARVLADFFALITPRR